MYRRPIWKRPGANPRNDILFVQQNVDKRADNIRIIHQLIQDKKIDLIVTQEPITGNKKFPRLPGFTLFTPRTDWSDPGEAPRVCTYVRRGHLKATMLPSPIPNHRDILLVEVGDVTFVNFYRGVADEDTWTEFVSAGWSPPARCIFVGDFNATHPTWSAPGIPDARRGGEIANWMSCYDLVICRGGVW